MGNAQRNGNFRYGHVLIVIQEDNLAQFARKLYHLRDELFLRRCEGFRRLRQQFGDTARVDAAQPVRAANPAVQPAQGGAAPQGMAANAVHPTAQPNGTATASAQPIPAHPVPGAPVPPMGGSGPSVGAAQEAVGAQNAQAFARPARQAAPEFVSAGQPVPPSEEEGGERV